MFFRKVAIGYTNENLKNMKCTSCKKQITKHGGMEIDSEGLDFLGLKGDAFLCGECSGNLVTELIQRNIGQQEAVDSLKKLNSAWISSAKTTKEQYDKLLLRWQKDTEEINRLYQEIERLKTKK